MIDLDADAPPPPLVAVWVLGCWQMWQECNFRQRVFCVACAPVKSVPRLRPFPSPFCLIRPNQVLNKQNVQFHLQLDRALIDMLSTLQAVERRQR